MWHANNNQNGQGLVIDDETGRTVAVAYDGNDTPILAASPELLDALTDLVGGCGKEGDLFSSAAMNKARAVIRRATSK